jgi:hypothetical protein
MLLLAGQNNGNSVDDYANNPESQPNLSERIVPFDESKVSVAS